MKKHVNGHLRIGGWTEGIVVAGCEHDLLRNFLEEPLYPLLVGGGVGPRNSNQGKPFMKRRAKRLPLGEVFVEGPGLIPLIAVFEEVRFVAELHADQLRPQGFCHKRTFSQGLFNGASAKVQAIDAAPAGGAEKALQIADRVGSDRKSAQLAMSWIGPDKASGFRWSRRLCV